MKYVKTYEKWINTTTKIKDYVVWETYNDRFPILKITKRYNIKGVDNVELERLFLYDLNTGKNIEDTDETWQHSTNYVEKHIKYQSDNLQDLIDIKNRLVIAKNYNL